MASKYTPESGKNQLKRITDVQYEPGKLLMPIEGYEKMKLGSLEEAIEFLVAIVPDIRRKAYIAKQRCQEPKDGLTSDESASIFLYTMEWDPDCVYSLLNRALRSEKRQALRPWFSYLKLMLSALWKLPSHKLVVYRGVKLDLSAEYSIGKTTIWWGFSSTTQSIQVLESEQFLGKTGIRTLFDIQCSNAKIIRNHSYYTAEDEALLLPATQLEITGKLDSGNGLHIITMKETEPVFPLLEPPFLLSEIKKKSKATPVGSKSKGSKFPAISIQDVDIHHMINNMKGSDRWDFKDQQVTADDVKLIANELKTDRNCRELDISKNGLTSAAVHYLSAMLKENMTLEKLYLGQNQIGDDGLRALCEALKAHEKNTLEVLSLEFNRITDRSVPGIIEILNLPNLTLNALFIHSNRLSEDSKQKLTVLAKTRNIWIRLD
ncbi:unnamed protein product [Rotaria sp. Silwood1]|nr:unnamed protein product [Rotaria sp. Silwood1]CAF3798087.1 unnamed protein product [Rotaria sp. Silwood1]CAF3870232.1 unnamed protein product [Rotaria sp. Silwood1]CAF4695083.1 unnamed protein product [Rotaria sp. Silwood1]CAF4961933.1 unnamed protein product [Rotaria sp. Silwood1]